MAIKFNAPQFKSFVTKHLEVWQKYCDEIALATEITAKEDEKTKKKRIAKLLSNYDAFVQYYFPNVTRGTKNADFHIDAAEEILADKNFRGVFEWARGHAKSTHMSLFQPIFLLVQDEFKNLVLTSQSEELACELLSKIQAHLQSNQRLIQDFGSFSSTGSWAEGQFQTKQGVKFKALGRGQSPRGNSSDDSFRPDYIIIDDFDDNELVENPKRVKKALSWINGALFGSMDMGRGRFVMVGNKIHKNSCLANVSKQKGIYHTRVNALNSEGLPSWHQKYTPEEIQEVREFIGEFEFQKEFMNNPIEEGLMFKYEWIQYAKIPKIEDFEAYSIYIDPSWKESGDTKGVAFLGLKNSKYYIIECFVRKCSITTLVSWCYDLYEKYLQLGISLMFEMEANFMQDELLEDFESEGYERGYQLPIIGDPRAKPNKEARISSLTPLFERGWIFFDEAKKDTKDFEAAKDQLLAFGKGNTANDDFPDALESAKFKLSLNIKTFDSTAFRIGKRLKPENI